MNPADPVTRIFIGEPSKADRAGRAPDVDDFAPVELELAIRLVGRADDQHVRLPKHGLKRIERRVMDIWVCAYDPRAFELGELAQLEAEGGAGVVGFALERHPENPDRTADQRCA